MGLDGKVEWNAAVFHAWPGNANKSVACCRCCYHICIFALLASFMPSTFVIFCV